VGDPEQQHDFGESASRTHYDSYFLEGGEAIFVDSGGHHHGSGRFYLNDAGDLVFAGTARRHRKAAAIM
jgi:hypothetical protein